MSIDLTLPLKTARHLLTCVGICLVVSQAAAQYPQISSDVQRESTRRYAEMEKNSDAAWEQALPVIKEWEAKGKPYIPWAAHPDDLPQADIPAFPGAEGGGMFSFGGRGGKVYVVTNLNNRGQGSFREACEAGGPRIVVFNVAGIIKLKERIRIRAPYITISGATAPGDGVCIAGDTVELESHDTVIRHMRFRRGETWVGDRNDSIGGNPIGNIMIDHVSASWGLDENMSMYRHMYSPPDSEREIKLPTVNITIQNSIFSECLGIYNHSFGSTIGGYNSTFHHNLWASNAGRNPSIGMIFDFTFANNVIFNWRHRTVDGGDHHNYYTIVNNYYKPGPATPTDEPIGHRILKPESRRSKFFTTDYGRAYVEGNIVEGNPEVTADNWNGGVQLDRDPPPADAPREMQVSEEQLLKRIRTTKPYPHSYLTIQPAAEAYKTVLENAGATLPQRDPVDERIVRSVRTGEVTAKPTGDMTAELKLVGYQENVIQSIQNSVEKGIISNIDQVGGYPAYEGTPYTDSDGDGMPDDWEKQYGLDPLDPSDAAGDLNGDGYTNIEDFINGLDPTAPKQDWSKPRTYVDLFWNVGR